jgi:hypothetical protein
MSHQIGIPQEVWRRIERLVNDNCTDEDIECIEESLRQNPEAQRILLDYCQLHLDLTMEIRPEVASEGVFEKISAITHSSISEQSSEPTLETKPPGRFSRHKLPISTYLPFHKLNTPVNVFGILLFGAMLVFFGGAVGWLARGSGQVSYAEPKVVPAAYLMSANGCSWGRDMPNLQLVGSEIQIGGEITLDEGIAEFRLANGVYVSLEGPAALVLASPLSLALQYGKVTAHVPWTVTDFKVSAGACRFTTCDADFGLIETGSKTDLHVFAGSVQVENPQVLRKSNDFSFPTEGSLVIDDSGALTKGTISAGNALSILHVGDVLKVSDLGSKAQPECFANKLSMAGPLPVTQAYIDAVIASKPLGYWRFESAADGMVPNEIPGGRELSILGDIRSVNQLGNSVAEFRPNLVGRFKCQPFTEQAEANYSFEAWVKPSHVHLGNILSFYDYNSGVYDSTSLLVHAGKDRRLKNPAGVFSFAHHRSRSSKVGAPEFYCFSKKHYDVRRWQHVVVSKDASHARIYIDGKLSASQRDATELAAGLTLSIGRNPQSRERRFVGQLDEVAVYNRALSKEEISRHYEIIDAAFRLPSTAQAVRSRVSRQRPPSRLQTTSHSGSANVPTFLAALN